MGEIIALWLVVNATEEAVLLFFKILKNLAEGSKQRLQAFKSLDERGLLSAGQLQVVGRRGGPPQLNIFRGDMGLNLPALTKDDMEYIAKQMTAAHATLLCQHNMELLNIPSGAMHCVVNIENCFKFASDTVAKDDLPGLSVHWARFISGQMRQFMVEDYASHSTMLRNIAAQLFL